TFDPHTGKPGPEWSDTSEVRALSNFFDDGKKIASLNESGVIKIWDVATGTLVQTLSGGDPSRTAALAFTSDGRTAVSYGNKFRFWDVAGGKVRKEFTESVGGHLSIVILPGDRTVAWNTSLGFVLYDLLTGVKKQDVKVQQTLVYA